MEEFKNFSPEVENNDQSSEIFDHVDEYNKKTVERKGSINADIVVLKDKIEREDNKEDVSKYREKLNSIIREKRVAYKNSNNINSFLEHLGWPKPLPERVDLAKLARDIKESKDWDRARSIETIDTILAAFKGFFVTRDQYRYIRYDIDIIEEEINTLLRAIGREDEFRIGVEDSTN